MRNFKTVWFCKWAKKHGLSDKQLLVAIQEMKEGIVDASLGGCVFKKRIGFKGVGKRGGARTLIAYKTKSNAFFVFGFTKNARENITDRELRALKLLATELLGYNRQHLDRVIASGELIEVKDDK